MSLIPIVSSSFLHILFNINRIRILWLDFWIIISNSVLDPDPDLYWIRIQLGQWIQIQRQAKIVPQKRKKWRSFMYEELSVGFSWSLNVLFRGLRRHIWCFLWKKFSFVIFSEILSVKTLVLIRIRINSLDPHSDSAKCLDPDPDSVNPDPQPWFLRSFDIMQIHHMHFFFHMVLFIFSFTFPYEVLLQDRFLVFPFPLYERELYSMGGG